MYTLLRIILNDQWSWRQTFILKTPIFDLILPPQVLASRCFKMASCYIINGGGQWFFSKLSRSKTAIIAATVTIEGMHVFHQILFFLIHWCISSNFLYDYLNLQNNTFSVIIAGITRLERWERAARHGLNPPADVKDIVERHKDDPEYLQW